MMRGCHSIKKLLDALNRKMNAAINRFAPFRQTEVTLYSLFMSVYFMLAAVAVTTILPQKKKNVFVIYVYYMIMA